MFQARFLVYSIIAFLMVFLASFFLSAFNCFLDYFFIYYSSCWLVCLLCSLRFSFLEFGCFMLFSLFRDCDPYRYETALYPFTFRHRICSWLFFFFHWKHLCLRFFSQILLSERLSLACFLIFCYSLVGLARRLLWCFRLRNAWNWIFVFELHVHPTFLHSLFPRMRTDSFWLLILFVVVCDV